MPVTMSRLVRRLTPYTPGEQLRAPGLIKLNTNENPYPPAPGVRAAAEEALAQDGRSLTLYPPAECMELRTLIAEQEGLPGPAWVYMGNGSDEILAFAFAAYFDPGKPVRFPDVTYSFYPSYCALWGLDYSCIPLAEDFTIHGEDYNGAGGGIVLPNPNAPTSLALPSADIEALAAGHPDEVVVVDEAYIAFGGETAVPLTRRYPNLLVVRTLSKSHALAGARVGYALGDPALIAALAAVKNSFNSYTLDAVAQKAAYAALADVEYTRRRTAQVVATRDRAAQALRELGMEVPPSASNFLFARHPQAEALYRALRERNILVRYFAKPARIADRLRISVGTDAEMDALLAALREILAGQ